jgi:hypothetical protein
MTSLQDGRDRKDIDKKTDEDRFSHIQIERAGDSAIPAFDDADDEEEIIEVGVLPATPSSSKYDSSPVQSQDDAAQGSYVDHYEQQDYGIEDLPPMPLIQKVILFIIVLAVVVIGYKIISYWVGF